MGSSFPVAGENDAQLFSAIQCVTHMADIVKAEYPSADVSQILLLTSLRLGEALCKESLQSPHENNKNQQMHEFIEKLSHLLLV